MLDVHPGCRVIETGTGSGCFTLSLARAVSPSGHVYTYEYNAIRAEAARNDFEK
jgi:tRNA (adenine57-N1/adenine58-N1)-methyltransferase